MNSKKLYKLFLWLLLSSQVLPAKAQDEMETDLESETPVQPASPTQLIKLKKQYLLGDGLIFQSPVGRLKISPTLQTLFTAGSETRRLSPVQNSFSIPRARITLTGNLFDSRINMVARLNLSANNQSATTGIRSFNSGLQEAYIEYRPDRSHVFNIGLRADYIDSRETRFQGENLGFTDRSGVSAAFDAIFDYGIRYKGTYQLGSQLIKTYASVTSGDSRSGLQKNYGGFKYGLRLDYLPFGKFSRGGEYYMEDLAVERKPRLVIGGVYSYNDGLSSATGTNGGRWLYADHRGRLRLPDQQKWVADYLFKYAGFYSLGSIVVTRASVPEDIAGEYRLNGSFISYAPDQSPQVTDSLVRSRLNLGQGYNVQAGYLFAADIAIGGRFSMLKARTPAADFAAYNRFYDLIVTRYFYDHNLKLQAQLGFNALDRQRVTEDAKGNYHAQIMATIQL